MRSLPQSGFSWAMVAINSRTSTLNRGRPSCGPGAPPPIEPPTLAVPADDGLRPDEDQMPPPIPVEPAGEHPEEPVPAVQSWAAPGSEGDLELLAQEEILEKEVVLAAEASRKLAEQEPEEGEHRIRIAGLASASGPVLSIALLR